MDHPYRSLEPDLRAKALVGEFMGSFALLEAELDDVLASALDLKTLQGVIVTKNLRFGSKVNALRCILQIAPFPRTQKEDFLGFAKKLGKFANDRNIAAHNVFGADEDGDGVKFITIKANGKLEFPDTSWSIGDIVGKCASHRTASQTLREIKKALATANVAQALMESSGPIWNSLLSSSSGTEPDHVPAQGPENDLHTEE